MDDYAGRVLADRYRLPLPPSDEYELAETRAFDTYSGQEVLVRQVPLPEVVEAEVLDADGLPEGFVARDGVQNRRGRTARPTRRPAEPAVRRAIEAAQAAAQIPDHPRLDQVFDVFAEGGSLWVVSELVAARPLAALLAEKPLTPYRAAEVASDVLMALRVLHAHGWVHRNITARTVLVCDDGRVMLSGLAVGAAEEALCGYDPVPPRDGEAGTGDERVPGPGGAYGGPVAGGVAGHSLGAGAGGGGPLSRDPEAARRAAIEAREKGMEARAAGVEARAAGRAPAVEGPRGGVPALGGHAPEGDDVRAARAGAIAAYRAGARAAARVQDEERDSRAALPGPRPAPGPAEPPSSTTNPSLPAPGGYGPGTGRGPGHDPETGRRPGYGAESGPGSGYGGGSRQASGYGPEGGQGLPAYGAGGGRGPGQGPDAGQRPGYGAESGPGSGYGGGSRQASGYGPEGGQGTGYGAGPEAGRGGANRRGDGGQGVEYTPGNPPPGQIADPYGVGRANPWHGAVPRTGPGAQGRTALPGGAGDQAHTAFHDPGNGGAPLLEPAQESVHEFGAAAATPAPATGLPHQQGRRQVPPQGSAPQPAQDTARWDHLVAGSAPRRGPATALAAERARQARMAVVGPVTERWAPEQAGPVHENWQLAAPIGPATDLWALGALLFRAVQGHAPYPEENTAELVQLVCAEPPAFAEECGPLRPVVESLLRQDPTERLDFEDLRGWLRSLVRSAPEPEAGAHVIAAPPVDPRRLPIVRRRGELVRRRRAGLPATSPHARHKRARQERSAPPRRLGRNLVLLVLLMLAAAVAYALYFMPKADTTGGTDGERTGAAEKAEPSSDTGAGDGGEASSEPRPDQTSPGDGKSPSKSAGSGQKSSDPDVAQGFTVRKDAEGFRVAVARGWDRAPKNGRGQVVYSHGDFQLIVVPGRDSTEAYGKDPMAYQRERERELQPFRDSTWATSSGMRTIDVGGRTMAEGQFTWTDGEGRELFVRNLAMVVGGRYHVVQVRGPEAERDEVTRLFEQASATYQVTG
ncbi:protein kinase [Streptomyces sp. NPDC005301]|uniref:protein kinase n=1 Tax=Streptomyces sp. NPDC005301 TaxID=3156874 RepID=UPI0033A46AB4